MKKLIMDNFENEYSVEVNSCLDYKIAGAASIYNKDFLKIYCAQWSIYTNWSNYDNKDIQDIILHNCGLFKKRISVKGNNIIDIIKKNIDNGYPILLFVATNTLYFSIVYKEETSKNIRHELLITGYDDEKEIIYIRENSINKEFYYKLLKTHPFMEYQLTYDMIKEIYNKNILIINNYQNNCLEVIEKIDNININQLKYETFKLFIKLFNNENDQLIHKIYNMIDMDSYDKRFLGEQYHRNYIQSIYAISKFLCNEFKIKLGNNIYDFFNQYLTTRLNIINLITKKVAKNNAFDKKSLLNYVELLVQNNKSLFDYIKEQEITIIERQNVNEHNLLYEVGTHILTDSHKIDDNGIEYSANCFLKEQNYITNNNYWLSGDNDTVHWMKVEFKKNYHINKIIIEHSKYITSITCDYDIFYSLDNSNWELLKVVQNNDKTINEFNFDNIQMKFIWIKFNKSNREYGKRTVVRNLFIYGY